MSSTLYTSITYFKGNINSYNFQSLARNSLKDGFVMEYFSGKYLQNDRGN